MNDTINKSFSFKMLRYWPVFDFLSRSDFLTTPSRHLQTFHPLLHLLFKSLCGREMPPETNGKWQQKTSAAEGEVLQNVQVLQAAPPLNLSLKASFCTFLFALAIALINYTSLVAVATEGRECIT